MRKFGKHFKLLCMAVIALSVNGCATQPPSWTNLYGHVGASDEQIVRFVHYFSNYREVIYIDNVAYPKSHGDPKNHFKLEPGFHLIEYQLRWKKKGAVYGFFRADLKAGHEYTLSHKLRGGPFSEYVRVTIRDETANLILYERDFSQPSSYSQ